MANLNKVFLMGNLTRDPELRYTPSGTAVADFGMAMNRRWTSQGGEKREEACFIDVQAWARSAEVICEYCKKGTPLFVEGRLRLESWEGRDGQKRSRLRVVVENFQFLGGRPGPAPENAAGGRRPARAEPPDQVAEDKPPTEPDEEDRPPDDIPF